MTNPEAVRVLTTALIIQALGHDDGVRNPGDIEDAEQTLAALPEGWALVNLAALRAQVGDMSPLVPASWGADGWGVFERNGFDLAVDQVIAILDRLASGKPA